MRLALPLILAAVVVLPARAERYCDFSKLPSDVSDLLQTYAACHVEGKTQEDTKKLQAAMHGKLKCELVEHDRTRLLEHYKDDEASTDALKQRCIFRIGFIREPRVPR